MDHPPIEVKKKTPAPPKEPPKPEPDIRGGKQQQKKGKWAGAGGARRAVGGGASAIVAAGVDIVPAFVKQLPKGQATGNARTNSKPPINNQKGAGGLKGKNGSQPINS